MIGLKEKEREIKKERKKERKGREEIVQKLEKEKE